MKRKIENRLNMYQSVMKVCNDHVSVWEGIPGFVDAFTAFKNTFDTAGLAAQKQGSKTAGVSNEKSEKLVELIDVVLMIHGTLKIHGKQMNDSGLVARNKITKSDLRNMSIQQMIVHMDILVEDIINHGSALAVYGVDEGTLEAALGIINEGKTVLNSPRNAIIERKFQTKLLDQYVKEMDELLQFSLDNLVRVHKKSHPEFFELYWNARLIIDPGVKKPTTPKEPD